MLRITATDDRDVERRPACSGVAQAPNGEIRAYWSITGEGAGGRAIVTATGSRVKIITVWKSVVEMTREADSLSGTMLLADGHSFAITMSKLQLSTAEPPLARLLVGQWIGDWAFRINRRHGRYVLTIERSSLTLHGIGQGLKIWIGLPGIEASGCEKAMGIHHHAAF
jgi:hypothetical protein